MALVVAPADGPAAEAVDPEVLLEERAKRRYPEVRSSRLAVLLYKRDVDFNGLVEPEDEQGQNVPLIEGVERAFDDDFTRNHLQRYYEIVDEGHRVKERSCWYVKGGLLHQAGDVWQQAAAAGQRHARRGTMILRKYEIYTNFELTVHFIRREGHLIRPGGVVFCVEDTSNYYLLLAEPPLPLRLYKVADDRFYVIYEAPEAGAPCECGVSVRITRVGDTMKVSYNSHVFHLKEGTHRTGRVGLLACGNNVLTAAHFACKVLKDPQTLLREIYYVPPTLTRQYSFGAADEDVRSYAEVIDHPEASFGPSTWAVERGRLVQRSNIRHTGDLPVAGVCAPRGSMFILEAPVMCTEALYRTYFGGAMGMELVGFGFVFQYRNAENYYLVRYEEAAEALRLVVVVRGRAEELARVPIAAAPGKNAGGLPLEVSVHRVYKNATEFTQFINVRMGQFPPIDVVNMDLPAVGRCGFLAFNNPHLTVSYLTVEVNPATRVGPPEQPPPPRVVNLCAMLATQAAELEDLRAVDHELRTLPRTITAKKCIVMRSPRSRTAAAPPRPSAAWQTAYALARRSVGVETKPLSRGLE
eukprot:TRINITY_DN32281_c0_g1_i1.p1 TRINITY_DN32281_c0_g1~~TRINITY_DN32281_c0_g1_i1.p1  ORF type:complete len:583 (+),score=207.80 TRINITY_DN32281_c0_g1_i1:57-1805(+)